MATLLKKLYVGYVSGNWYLKLYEDSISQSISGNYTDVHLRLTLSADRSTWTSFDNRDAWIQDTHFKLAYRYDNTEHNLGTKTIRIKHNANGTGSYSAGFGMATSYVQNGSGSGGRTLPTIPRASSFSVSSNNTMGKAMSVTITRASSSFTHTVRYQFGSIVREYAKQGTSCSFTPPYTDASQIPNSMSGTGTITVYTYNGSTRIGTKSASFTLSVESSVFAPTFTGIGVTRIDNGVPAAWDIYVQGKSKASLQILGASAKYGASIKTYQISVEGFSGGNGLVAGPFRSGTISIKATLIDSRNITTNQVTQITVYENAPPALSLKAERCNSAGTVVNNGTYIKITPTYSCASVNGKNYITSKVFKINGTSYQNTTGASGASFILGTDDIAVSKAYVVTGVVTDALEQKSSQIEINVPTSSVPLHVREAQDGVAFGKYSEKKEYLESIWPIEAPNFQPMTKVNGYYGFPNVPDYIRTPIAGILPYQSGGSGTVGTSGWPFNNGYFNNLYQNGALVADCKTGNGWYAYKFSNGLLIQFKYTQRTFAKYAWGSIYSCDSDETSIYPVAFADIPVRHVSHCGNSTYNWWGAGFSDVNNDHKKKFGRFSIIRGADVKNFTANIMLCAIGRWK